MILANVRQRLTRDDAQLALRLVSRNAPDEMEHAEEELRDHGIDTLLDDPRLASALLHSPQGAHASARLFTYVIVRHALREMGEPDRGLADYVASILLHFGAPHRAERVADHDDEVYDTLAALLRDAESGDAGRAFLVRAHLGNYALWLSGLFPDHIEFRRWRRGGPDMDYFDEMGRRGYELAARHRLASQYGLDGLFSSAAERFPRLRVALNRVSDRLLFPGAGSPERLMRQVRDETRWVHHS
jgi:hypothetical protein